jgi:bleomycin hydrolase
MGVFRMRRQAILSVLLVKVLLLTVAIGAVAQPERRDHSRFIVPRGGFLDTIRASAAAFKAAPAKPGRELRLDFSTIAAPASPGEFTSIWHTPPVSQGLSGMCWCFSATSYYESEMHRLSGRSIKLSELYTVYWEYVEKARRFVRERGASEFGEGSEANAVPRIWKQYGIVPADAYTGLRPGQRFHDHEALYEEMRGYLDSVKKEHAWNEEVVIATIRSILDHALGAPPSGVAVEGKTLTPKEYLAQVVRLHLDDYVEILSLLEKPYYQKVELEVPDNWWHSAEYYNVPLDVFMGIIRKVVRARQGVCIGGDTSEPGLFGEAGLAVVPTFDIPPAYIDDHARQFRFSNHTTADDHGIHVVGYTVKNGAEWYLIKDSGSGSRNNSHPGYYFYHEDYVKLKMLGFTVHRSLVEDVLSSFRP